MIPLRFARRDTSDEKSSNVDRSRTRSVELDDGSITSESDNARKMLLLGTPAKGVETQTNKMKRFFKQNFKKKPDE